jgi:peptidoglycan/xylan/chitin deacetylase (PgdA/CDA1 family)
MHIGNQSKEMSQPQLWKGTGAVSLSFDDGSASQLEIAIPTLNQFGIHATFYINPRMETDLAPWREVGLSGHEIGNHTQTRGLVRRLENRGTEEKRRLKPSIRFQTPYNLSAKLRLTTVHVFSALPSNR